MTHSDPISDMISRIKNAIKAMHESVDIPASKIKVKIAEVLKKEGYINSYEMLELDVVKVKKILRIHLKYGPRGEKLIKEWKRVSSPGLRIYTRSKNAPRVLSGLGVSIISTSKGLMSDRQARKEGIGGEVLCQIW
ncbi:MAG: 30S ribosomal protein S8 [Candidatus Melainabacteria bacterium]|nr:30S ribosomal protein S8 [Candidatus Melainabacteria bacterium]